MGAFSQPGILFALWGRLSTCGGLATRPESLENGQLRRRSSSRNFVRAARVSDRIPPLTFTHYPGGLARSHDRVHFEIHNVAPGRHPLIDEPAVVCLHQLKA